MCGIAGFYYESKNLDESRILISNMIHVIKHRGPDNTKAFYSKNYCCATSRLEIENIKEGFQPLLDREKKFIINFNGEIFNYKQLIKKYFSTDIKIRTEISLLLELFKKKGITFIEEIQGQFAIAIFDISKEKLYLFRDRFGIRPLFYSHNSKKFIFSSEIKSIGTFIGKELKTSFNSILNVSMIWTNYGNLTAFENIYQLEPGSVLTFQKGEIKLKKYWKNPIVQFNANDELENNLEPNFLYLELEKAVKRQIHGEVGFASYLSGGIDSSILAYLLTKINKAPIDTFSVEFEDKQYDESVAQHEVKNFIKSNHKSIKISKSDIANNFEKTVNHAESHLFRTAPVPMFLLSKLVRESGHKVVFTGEGADEILLGYDIFAENRIRKFWSRNKNSKIRPQLLRKLYRYLPQFQNPRYFEIVKEFYFKNLNNTNDIFYSHLVRWDQFEGIKGFFNGDLINSHYKKVKKDIVKFLPKNFKSLTSDRKSQILELDTLLANYLLSSQGDRMSMANGVEGRYPYLDDTFNYELSKISSKTKFSNLKLKTLLRDSFKKFLPSKVVERRKIAYQAPEAMAFFNKGKKANIVKEFRDDLKKNDNLNREAYENLISKFEDENADRRIGFRENMAFIIGLSDFCLRKSAKSWLETNYKDSYIEYTKF